MVHVHPRSDLIRQCYKLRDKIYAIDNNPNRDKKWGKGFNYDLVDEVNQMTEDDHDAAAITIGLKSFLKKLKRELIAVTARSKERAFANCCQRECGALKRS